MEINIVVIDNLIYKKHRKNIKDEELILEILHQCDALKMRILLNIISATNAFKLFYFIIILHLLVPLFVCSR